MVWVWVLVVEIVKSSFRELVNRLHVSWAELW